MLTGIEPVSSQRRRLLCEDTRAKNASATTAPVQACDEVTHPGEEVIHALPNA